MTIYLKGSRFVPVGGGTMSGALTIASGTLTASAPALNITQTWNNVAVGFVGIDMVITDTTSSGASYPLRIYRNGSNVLSLTKAGVLYVTTVGANMDVGANSDTYLFRDAAATLAQRNGAAAQTLRVYGTADGTPGSNYQRASLSADGSTGITLAAEGLGTPTANQDITLLPGGTGVVRFGTRTAIGAETLTGFITIKDAGGTTRKLAVVS